MIKPKIRKSVISGRELVVCDNMIERAMMERVGNLVRTMHYVRTEKSRAGVPGYVASARLVMNHEMSPNMPATLATPQSK